MFVPLFHAKMNGFYGREEMSFLQPTKKHGAGCIDRALSCSEFNPVRTKAEAKCRCLHLRQLQTPTGEADPHQRFEWKGCVMISLEKKQTWSKIRKHCGTSSASTSTQCNSYSQKKIAWYDTDSWKATSVSQRTSVFTCMGGDFELTVAKREDFKMPLWGFSALLT